MDVSAPVLGPFVLLNQLPHGLGDGNLICLVLLGLGAKAISGGRVREVANLPATQALRRAALEGLISPLHRVNDDAPDVLARLGSGAAHTSARSSPCWHALTLLCRFTSQPTSFVGWDPGTSKPPAFREEALACVAFHEEALLLIPELIP